MAAAYKVIQGAIRLALASFEIGEFSGRISAVTQSFNRLSAGIGITATELRDRFAVATRGYVKDSTLLTIANTALISQNENIINRLPGILEKATQLFLARGQDVEQGLQDITLAILRQSPLILDNAGIYVRLGEVNAQYARELGKTVEQLTTAERQIAFLNATERAAIKATSELSDVVNDGARIWVRYNNELERVRVNFGRAAAEGRGPIGSLIRLAQVGIIGTLQTVNLILGNTSNQVENRTIPPFRRILQAVKDIDLSVRAIPRDNVLRFRIPPPDITPLTQVLALPQLSQLRPLPIPEQLREDYRVQIDPELELRSDGEPFRNMREVDDRLRSELDTFREDFADTFHLDLELGPQLYEDLLRINGILDTIQNSFGQFAFNAITDFKNIGEAAADLGRQLRNLVINELVARPIAQFARDFFRGAVNQAFRVPGDIRSEDVLQGQQQGQSTQVSYQINGVQDPSVVEGVLARSYSANENLILANAQRDANRANNGLS